MSGLLPDLDNLASPIVPALAADGVRARERSAVVTLDERDGVQAIVIAPAITPPLGDLSFRQCTHYELLFSPLI